MNAMKASELVALLQKRINEYGDLKIVVNTQDGGSYSLIGEDSVRLVTSYNSEGKEVHKLEIG